MNRKNKVLAALGVAAVLSLGTPVVANAAPSVAAVAEATKVVPMACSWKTQYHWDWFQCWVIIGSPPSSCYYRVYTCS